MNVRYFFKNVWIFRRELTRFRAFDVGFNLGLFERSLEETAKFLDSERAVYSVCSRDRAEEIRSFLDCLSHYRDPCSLAEIRLGHSPDADVSDWLEAMDAAKKKFSDSGDSEWVVRVPPRVVLDRDDDRRYHVECDKIERKMWDRAWRQFSKQGRGWWD